MKKNTVSNPSAAQLSMDSGPMVTPRNASYDSCERFAHNNAATVARSMRSPPVVSLRRTSER